jgi:hypothetical protein
VKRAADLQRRGAAAAVLVAAAGAATACGSDPAPATAAPSTSAAAPSTSAAALPQGHEKVNLDPANFTVDITNRWWPMEVGDRWVYEESDGKGGVLDIEVTVLDRTKTVAAGVEARVVHDVGTDNGEVVEDTLDYYAQDADGNVWYLGEKTAEYENGRLASTEGSWEAGVDGGQGGILLPADPQVGMGYRQEYLAGHAEDEGYILSTGEQVQVPAGLYKGTLMTRDTSPLEPKLVELKFYAAGVGPVMEVPISGEYGRNVLVETTRTG